MAEELRRRGVLGKSEEFFLKSLEANPLDYRTYISLAEAYLKMDRFDEAKAYLEESLPHAPRLSRFRQEREIERRRMRKSVGLPLHESEAPSIFDYKSYSYRLIGHMYACRESILTLFQFCGLQ